MDWKVRISVIFKTFVFDKSPVDGKEICPINDDQLRQCCQEIREKSIKDIVLVGLFSPLGNQEEYAREFILNILGPENINVVCSRDGRFAHHILSAVIHLLTRAFSFSRQHRVA